MILDAKELLSDAQALTASAASTNYKDFGKDRNIGIGEPICVMITPTVAADSTTGDETYKFGIQVDDNSGFSTPTTILERTIAASLLTKDSIHVLPIPADKSAERYLRVYYTLGGTTPLITITAVIMPVKDVTAWAVYPGAYVVGT